MFTKKFWLETIERAVKTSAQFVIGAGILGEGVDLFTVDLATAGGFALTGALLSVLTSLVSVNVGATSSPSVVE